MATLPGMESDVYFGGVDEPLPDWRANMAGIAFYAFEEDDEAYDFAETPDERQGRLQLVWGASAYSKSFGPPAADPAAPSAQPKVDRTPTSPGFGGSILIPIRTHPRLRWPRRGGSILIPQVDQTVHPRWTKLSTPEPAPYNPIRRARAGN